MSILEDAQNLSPTGKICCAALFALGALFNISALATSQALQHHGGAKRQKQTEALMIAANPEEVANKYGVMPPQNDNEYAQRATRLFQVGTRIQNELTQNQITKETLSPNKLVFEAVKAGLLHPSHGSHLWDEYQLLETYRKQLPETPSE
jgi:hypothetical protein